MRTPRRVKQRMYYVLPKKLVDEYKRDEKGEIVYREVNGKKVAVKDGKRMTYSSPTLFYNSITSTLTADELASFGADNSGKKAKITYRAGEFPFKSGTLIWLSSPVGYKNGEIDPSSADYIVVGIQNTGQYFYNAMLKEVVK